MEQDRGSVEQARNGGTWARDVIQALANLGGRAPLADIYREVGRIRPGPHPPSFEAIIRRTIEERSSDSQVFTGEDDLFYSAEGLGAGVWGLRSPVDHERLATGVWRLEPGDTIRRTQLHHEYGGGGQGGISPSTTTPNVLIFTDPRAGTQHGYIYDGWDTGDPTLFRYTGEGQHGDQRMVAGNRTILEHAEQARELRLFKGVRDEVRYVGQFKLDSVPYEVRRAPASGGGPDRDVIVFRLRPTAAAVAPTRSRPANAGYRRSAPSPVAGSEQPFVRDPNQLDRALRAHADIQNGLNDFLVAAGAQTWSPGAAGPDFDLAWVRGGISFVAEVKSLTDANEDRQLRLGLGQILDYQELMSHQTAGVRAVLVVERQPRDYRWLTLCERHRVILVWPDTFGVLLDPTLTAAL